MTRIRQAFPLLLAVLAVYLLAMRPDLGQIRVIYTPPGPSPGPEPEPVPDPNAPPVNPQPGQIAVLIVDETADYGTPAYRPYLSVLSSKQVAGYLGTHCRKEGSQPAWRHWDQHVEHSGESALWAELMSVPRESTPWIVIDAPPKRYSGKLPDSIDATLALLKAWGGA